jgi:hypothetical protein
MTTTKNGPIIMKEHLQPLAERLSPLCHRHGTEMLPSEESICQLCLNI